MPLRNCSLAHQGRGCLCVSDSQKSSPANASSEPAGVETQYKVDHFDGDVVQSERPQPSDSKDEDKERSSDKDRTYFRGKDPEKVRDETTNRQSSATSPDDKFERSV